VNAPTIRPHHGQVGGLLVVAQGRQCISTFVWCESATSAAVLDAGPLVLLPGHG
jgi:hypothetical protein